MLTSKKWMKENGLTIGDKVRIVTVAKDFKYYISSMPDYLYRELEILSFELNALSRTKEEALLYLKVNELSSNMPIGLCFPVSWLEPVNKKPEQEEYIYKRKSLLNWKG